MAELLLRDKRAWPATKAGDYVQGAFGRTLAVPAGSSFVKEVHEVGQGAQANVSDWDHGGNKAEE